ncbi:MAG: 4-hydroxythreonine-4-phosphate dehydrogenase PdxA [Ignavibacteriales bacterium]|nr:4-hydroxythreonine-4-phosphate dehydrogenase PdxA [Ignavibacteriales bacterium]
MKTFAFTCGDINGIGPEIVLKTINKISSQKNIRIVFICPINVFKQTLNLIHAKFSYHYSKEFLFDQGNPNSVLIYDFGTAKLQYGKETANSGRISYQSIITACKLAKEKKVDAIVTAPISKFAFQKAKIRFPGHTELLAEYFGVKNYAMMFVSKKMKAGLITIHIPIKEISEKLTKSKLENTIDVIMQSLRKDFGIENPKVALLGLNPHSGENGKIGKEEIELLNPVIKRYSKFLNGPFVPDAFFGNHLYRNFDCTIGIYHDQILIPFKLMNFDKGVNFTAGLRIVRTSPDHGTAYDIAGKGIANAQSTIEAFNFAKLILKNR